MKYMLILGLPHRMFREPCEWFYRYSDPNDNEVMHIMASILAYRGGDKELFFKRWSQIKNNKLRFRKNIDELEHKFLTKLHLEGNQ